MHQELQDDTDMNGSDPRSSLLAALAPRLVELAVVAREQHVTRAARKLGTPQPTLSRRIARLEEELGVELLARPGRQVRLTAGGRTLWAAVERALDELDHGLHQVLDDTSPDRGRVAVGFLHTLGPVVVPRILREFRALHPGIRFDLVQDGHDVMLARLREGTVDVCLTSPVPDDPAFAAHPLQEQRLTALVPAGHPLAARPRLRLGQLSGETFVGLKPGYGIRRITDAWCIGAGFTPQLAFAGDDIDTVRGLVAAGLGLALLPAEPDRPLAGTVEVAVSPGATRTIGVVWARERQQTPPGALFRAFLQQAGPDLMSPDPPGDARTGAAGLL
jgi:DNA-binding transcriptional LysR family regulator